MTTKAKHRILDFVESMQPGDQIRRVDLNGKSGFELMKAQRNQVTGEAVPESFKVEFLEIGKYGYFKL